MPYADPQARRDYDRRWWRQRRAAFFRDKSCEWCHAREDLELHHRNPDRKLSHRIWSWGEKRRLTEIAKCIVLCGSCHKRAHAEMRRLEAELRHPHGTYRRYKLGCHCDSCRAANAEYARCHASKRDAA